MKQEPASKREIKIQEFKVFPKHLGVWQGKWLRLDANGQESARLTATLSQKIVDNRWVQSNTYNYADGTTVTHHFVGIAIAKGVVEITGGDSAFSQYRSLAEEHGENLIIFNVWEKASGALIGLETINLVRPDYCIRTSQGLAPDGTLKSLMVITEQRTAWDWPFLKTLPIDLGWEFNESERYQDDCYERRRAKSHIDTPKAQREDI